MFHKQRSAWASRAVADNRCPAAYNRGMTERKSSLPLLALSVFAGLALLLGSYISCYVWLSDLEGVTFFANAEAYQESILARTYRYTWQATVFSPLASVESALRGQTVKTRSPLGFSDDPPTMPVE